MPTYFDSAAPLFWATCVKYFGDLFWTGPFVRGRQVCLRCACRSAELGGFSQNLEHSFCSDRRDAIETTSGGRGSVGSRPRVERTRPMQDGDMARREECLMKCADPSILIADDDPDTCLNLRDIFTDLSYQVETAHDGRSALQKVRQYPFDVGLFDYRMPGMDGLTLCREVRRLHTAIVPMIITAFAPDALADEARTAGVSHILSKPIDFPKLLALVDEALARPLVLVVDDDPDLGLSLEDVLHERSYRVCVAQDEQTVVEHLQNATFQVVLISMRLPHSVGSTVLRLVRQANPQARTVLVAGYRADLETTLERPLDAGADVLCCKPFDVEQLFSTFERLVAPEGRT